MTAVTALRRVVTITFDPSQEVGELEAGPVFTDEYTALVCSDDDTDAENLLRLDGIHEALVTDYLDAWSRVATRIADQENIDLYVVVSSAECDENTDPLARALHERISAHVRVSGSGDTWFVSTTDLDNEAEATEGRRMSV